MSHAILPTGRGRSVALLLVCYLVFWISAPAIYAANNAKKSFAVAPGEAAKTLKQFAEQAGREIIFSTPSVRGITTNSVRGEFTVRDGLDRLLAGTELRAAEDTQTGGLMVQRAEVPNDQRATSGTDERPTSKKKLVISKSPRER